MSKGAPNCMITMERRTTKHVAEQDEKSGETDSKMTATAAAGKRVRDVTAEDWRKMTLMQKWKTSWNQDYADQRTSRMASRLGWCVLLYTAVSMEYVTISFGVDEYFSEYSPTARYYMRVLATFVFIQALANWLCTVCYKSDLRETRDNPDIEKLLWDEHPEENGGNTPDVQQQLLAEDANSNKTGLTWKWCQLCNMKQPPRAHHCKICERCILKRDHHCYFTGTCIGYYNQRYFVFLVFYLALSAGVYFPLFLHYMSLYYAPLTTSWWDYFLPTVAYSWLTGANEFKWVVLVSHYYCVWWGGLMAMGFLVTQILAIRKGLTSHEMYKRTVVRSTASVSENIQDVFGACWGLNFFLPGVILYRQTGDGKHWDNVKKI